MKKQKYLAVAILLFAVLFLFYSGMKKGGAYYLSLEELIQKAETLEGRGIRVSGKVKPGSIKYDKKSLKLRFVMTDENDQNEIVVDYQGALPDTFKPGATVIVEGKYSSQAKIFKATTLLAKCPSKYESEE